MELVALEYREEDFRDVESFRERLEEVMEGCLGAGLGAVGLAALLGGTAMPLRGEESPGLLLGLRTGDLAFAAAFAEELGARGLTGLMSLKGNEGGAGEIPRSLWAGTGVVLVPGRGEVLVGKGPKEVREALEGVDPGGVWMPGVDRRERAVDGLVLEEARRKGVRSIWIPGVGVNRLEKVARESPEVITARVDDGREPLEGLVAWARGDRLERGRARLKGLRSMAERWI